MSQEPVAVNVKISRNRDETDDWEDHLILRVPPDVVKEMEKILNNDYDADTLGINICDETRTVQILLGNQILPAKLLDLPTINEVHKTFDNNTLYKVTDISQIIICDGALPESKEKPKVKSGGSENQTPCESSGEGTSEKPKTARQIAKEKSKVNKYPHGITAPMKNAKKRKFRKKKEKKTMAVEEIERELRRLLRADLEAQSVRWEIVEGEGTQETEEDEEEDLDAYDPEDGSDDEKDDHDSDEAEEVLGVV